MKLTIHRGAQEIGGTCIEIQTTKSDILVDFGIPLVDEHKEKFNSDIIKNQSPDALIQQGILPSIKGLYKKETPIIDGIPDLFISIGVNF